MSEDASGALTPGRVSLIGRYAEHSGGLALVAVGGTAPHAELIDHRSASVERLPLELGAHTLALRPASGDRAARGQGSWAQLAEQRRHECEQAAHRMGVESLRDALFQDLHMLPDVLARRARHVIAENGRALQAAEALRRGDLALLGRLIDASHASLRDDYELSGGAAVRLLPRGAAAPVA